MKKYYAVNVANARRNTMTSKPARLNKQPNCGLLEQELKISVKSLLFLAFLVILFFIVVFMTVPQTYGFL